MSGKFWKRFHLLSQISTLKWQWDSGFRFMGQSSAPCLQNSHISEHIFYWPGYGKEAAVQCVIDPAGQTLSLTPETSIFLFICRLQDCWSVTPPSYKYHHHWSLMWLRMTVLSSPVLVWFLPHLPSQAVMPVSLWLMAVEWLTLGVCFRACNLRGRNGCWVSVSNLNTSLCCLMLPFLLTKQNF